MTEVTCERVSKTYGASRVLLDIDFVLSGGTVTGLIGPNGSGKSTLLRIIAGLGLPSSGSITFSDPGAAARSARPSVGAFLGAANHHPGRTVLETLRLAAYLSHVPESRVSNRMEWSGLAPVRRRLVRGLSLGMKVRLGMALATMRAPSVLLLDEPMNGLDIEGIAWIRDFVRQSRDEGRTVLVSSHLLRELEPLIDRSLILSKGRLVADSRTTRVGVGRGLVRVRVDDDTRFESCIRQAGLTYRREDGAWIVESTTDSMGRRAFQSGVVVLELSRVGGENLEDLVARSARGEFAPGSRGVL